MKRISSPIESLIKPDQGIEPLLETDFLIVGSGYGGAVAAMRLASKDAGSERHVVVLERGKEYGLGDFPYDFEDMPSHIRMVRDNHNDSDGGGYFDALFHIHVGNKKPREVGDANSVDNRVDNSVTDVLVGSGLGGTSLINANVAEEPLAHVFRNTAWPQEFRKTDPLKPDPLKAEFEQVRKHIGVTTHTAVSGSGQPFSKYTALQRLGREIKFAARPATIAVSTQTASNGVGVQQNPCTDCGNCVTGCNVGAKNTLDRNLLRLAKSRGATFFTGATVHSIEPLVGGGEYRWKIHVRPTVQPKGTLDAETYWIRAKNVILAAGTLGSTEILFRSRKDGEFELSPRLGDKFSTNGDGLIMSYGQKEKVGAIARADQKNSASKVGPTITGIIRTQELSIEEASIPAPLARIFSELVTTSAMLQRLADRKLPSLFQQENHDPLAASMGVAEHCQTLLIMGEDGANGTLSLPETDGPLKIHLPFAHENPALVASNILLKKQDRKPGLDGGQYAPNPLWQLMPPEASGVIGDLPDGRVLSVHPLGGCAMADNIEGGVVDHAGRVFKPGGVHEGLYVFDGSIIPTALEVNPFLTIAALAWRNSSKILEKAKTTESTVNRVISDYDNVGAVPNRERNRPRPTAFVIQEQLTGEIKKLTPWFERNLSHEQQKRITETAGLVVQVSAPHSHGESWLDNPGSAPLMATMQFYVNPLSAEDVTDFQPVGVNREHLQMSGEPFLTLGGSFTIFAEDHYDESDDFRGGIKAICTYIKRRGLGSLSFGNNKDSLLNRISNFPSHMKVFYNIGVLQSRFRRMRYAFEDRVSGISIHGEKVTGYSDKIGRMWPELLNLVLRIEDTPRHSTTARLKVNTEYLLEPGLVEIKASANLPQSLLFAGGLAGFFARSLLVTNFWEFGGLEHPDLAVVQRTTPPPLKTRSSRIQPEFFDIWVPVRAHSLSTIKLLLTRYKKSDGEPILLLHGLAQGSQIYWTETVNNLASHFYDAGYDVWLLDYRLSNHVLPIDDQDWSMDEIAQFDIPMAINEVYSRTGQKKVSIFGHCVGGCTLAMAVLNDPALGGKIKAAVTNAIHPWVIASTGNRFRAKFGGFYRDWVAEDLLDPIPRPEKVKGDENDHGAVQNVLDRLAFGLARIEEKETDDHQKYGGSALVKGICDRMNFLYGRMWNHDNLSRQTHEAFRDMLGPAPLGVYQHMYYYTQLRRLTDKDGENCYLDRARIQQSWTFPILFAHGGDSRVFNPHSARRSARRLKEILHPSGQTGNIAVGYEIFPGYGHMDVIFGKNAHKDCFPTYVNFLKNQTGNGDPRNARDWPEPYEARPATGPVLRAAWIENNKVHLRLWCELRTNLTSNPTELVAAGGNRAVDYEIQTRPSVSPPSVPRYRFIDIEIDDKDSKIQLTLHGNIEKYQIRGGARVEYDKQAWLQRLRATPVSPPQRRMRFAVGSCRYPGSIVDNALSDKVYAAILEHTSSAEGAQLLFLIGDQIYADATDQLFDVKSLKSRYMDRYRLAFSREGSPHFARLVAQIPTHFALDDHEIDDNWSALPPPSTHRRQEYADKKKESEYAVDTAARFMSSGRNQASIPTPSKLSASPFYYALANPHECDFPTFVADTRTEREFRGNNNPAIFNLISDDQYDALTGWLSAATISYPDAPKFIFSGSIIAPLPTGYCQEKSTWRQLDGWAGYPRTLENLLVFIAQNNISKVVFVGGDAHISSVSRLEVDASGSKAVIRQIVSSGLYAPMPFANAHVEDYLWNQQHPLPVHGVSPLSITCTNTLLSEHCSQFVCVDASAAQITVTCVDQNNTELNRVDLFQ